MQRSTVRALVGSVIVTATLAIGSYGSTQAASSSGPDTPVPQIVAHRGGSALAPENTLASFAAGLRTGVDQLELDVRYTKDHVLVVHHDPTIGFIQCVGPYTGYKISELTFAQVRAEDCGHPTMAGASTVPGTRIPTLDEVYTLLDRSSDTHVRVQVEVKRSPTDRSGSAQEFLADIGSTLASHHAQSRTILTSFDWHVLAAAHADPSFTGVGLMALGSTVSLGLDTGSMSWYTGVRLNAAPYHGNVALAAQQIAGADAVSLALQPFVTPTIVGQAHDLGMTVALWTLDSPATLHQAIALSPDALVTDEPVLARRILAARGDALPAAGTVPDPVPAAVPDWSASPDDAMAYTGRDGHVHLRTYGDVAYTELGGAAAGAPVVVRSGGTVYAIVRSSDRNYWIRSAETRWSKLGSNSSVCPTSDPSATVANSTLYLACVGADRALHYATASLAAAGTAPVLGAWRSLGGVLTSAPVVWIDGATVRFGGVGRAGATFYTRSADTRWVNTGTPCGAAPDAVTADGATFVVCQARTGHGLNFRVGDHRGTTGAVSGRPGIVAAGDHQAKVFVQGTNGKLYTMLLGTTDHTSFAGLGNDHGTAAVGGVAATTS